MFRGRYRAGLVHLFDALCGAVTKVFQFWNWAFFAALCNAVFQRGLNTIHILPFKPQIHLTGISVFGDREIHGKMSQEGMNYD